jgi:hypothetical protein
MTPHPKELSAKTTADAPGCAVGAPSQIRACLFDLDGVLTRTAKVQSADTLVTDLAALLERP